jgi:hypothetical protein
MEIHGMGLNLAGKLLFSPVDERAFTAALKLGLERNAETMRRLARTTAEGVRFRGEVQRAVQDPGDPRLAGWSFLVNSADPQRREIEAILSPLAMHRGMADPEAPLVFNSEPQDDWFDWLQDNYHGLSLEGKRPPHYIMLVGGPAQVPFQFQSLLKTAANVGRVDFDTLDDLKKYVEKLIRVETAAEPCVAREVVLFAPDAGLPDATYFSRTYMAEPLVEHIRDQLGFTTEGLLGREATKENLLKTLRVRKPALVYTTSHGLGAIGEPLEFQKQYNGAICCQHVGQLTLDHLFSADDVPLDESFLEGTIVFQFACFGYGTPAESDYAHWIDGVPQVYGDSDFVAGLPKRLLAHPRGPIAFIGHLDTAFLHGFAEVTAPHTLARWHTRISPFKFAVDQLLAVQPLGQAMQEMAVRFNEGNARITSTADLIRRKKWRWDADREAKYLDTWITRSDAQNYMIFGDPAAHARIPAV